MDASLKALGLEGHEALIVAHDYTCHPHADVIATRVVGKNRVPRPMRANRLLAPVRRGHPRGDRTHSGRIRT